MLARTLSKILLSATGILSLALYLVACEGEPSAPQTPQPVKVHAIKLLYPPEARTLITTAVDRVNAKNIQLKNGSIVRLSASSFDNLAGFEKIGTPQMPAALWIAPYTPLAASVKRSLQADVSIIDCNSTMSTRLGVAYRQIDSFAVPQSEGSVQIRRLLLPSQSASGNSNSLKEPSIVAGSPRFTASGLAAALSAAAVGTNLPLSALTTEGVSKAFEEIRRSQRFIRNYFISDYDTLTWLNDRPGGEPLFVLTTEQSFKTHRIYTPQSSLEWSPTTGPDITLDYPLCSVVTKSDAPQDVEAANAIRLFFASEEFKSMLQGGGFAPPASLGDINSSQLGAAAATLVSQWPKIRRPSMTTFVVDASIKTDRTALETVRREIKLFIESRPSPEDSVAIISASTTPEILSEPSTNAEILLLALARLNTTGGNAIRDGIQTAFTIFSDLTSRDYRRAIIVFTSSKDTSSQTSITQLSNRASQLVGRKNVDLFVFGLGGSEADFGELPSLTRQSGGTFVATTVASLPADLFPVARRVQ